MTPEPPPIEGAEHHWIEAGGIKVHYAEAGDPGGRPVLLLHGWPQHHGMWGPVIQRLSDQDLRLIAPDLRGFGWSEAPGDGYHPDRFALDQIALLDALEIERAMLIGHDWGGFTSLLMGMRFADRVERILALNEPHPWPRLNPGLALQTWRSWYATVAAVAGTVPRVHVWLARTILSHGNAGDPFTPAQIDHFANRFSDPARARAGSALYRNYFRLLAFGLRQGWRSERLLVPTLLLFGEQDLFIPKGMVEERQGPAPGLSVELVSDSGHFIVDEKPDLVAERALAHFGREGAGNQVERSEVGPA